MWTCPKCGRTFQKQNQSHYCGEAPKTIDAYIERISWSMPTFWEKHNLIQFAAHKNHIGLYAGTEAVKEFEERLKDYKTSKGTIHLRYDKPLPLELIADIARWCYKTGNHP